MCIAVHVKRLLLLSDFNETWIFLTDFRKMLRFHIWRKSVQWETELFHTDGHTDMRKLIVAFRSFANAKKCEGRPAVIHDGKLFCGIACQLFFSSVMSAINRITLLVSKTFYSMKCSNFQHFLPFPAIFKHVKESKLKSAHSVTLRWDSKFLACRYG